jgi:hypothetical protein
MILDLQSNLWGKLDGKKAALNDSVFPEGR